MACADPAEQPGVLVDCIPPNANFSWYSQHLLDRLIPIVLIFALVLIIFSGVQYMVSGITPESQKAAKNRIIGTLSGVIFFVLIRFLANQIGGTSAP